MVTDRWQLLGDTCLSPVFGVVMDIDLDNQTVSVCPLSPGTDPTTRITKRIEECQFQYLTLQK